jgi:hypothetical protein
MFSFLESKVTPYGREPTGIVSITVLPDSMTLNSLRKRYC